MSCPHGPAEGGPSITAGSVPSTLHPLLQTAARRARVAVAGETGEHVALVVGAHPLGARALHVGAQRPVFRAADPDAVAPPGIANLVAAPLGRLGRSADRLARFGARP